MKNEFSSDILNIAMSVNEHQMSNIDNIQFNKLKEVRLVLGELLYGCAIDNHIYGIIYNMLFGEYIIPMPCRNPKCSNDKCTIKMTLSGDQICAINNKLRLCPYINIYTSTIESSCPNCICRGTVLTYSMKCSDKYSSIDYGSDAYSQYCPSCDDFVHNINDERACIILDDWEEYDERSNKYQYETSLLCCECLFNYSIKN